MDVPIKLLLLLLLLLDSGDTRTRRAPLAPGSTESRAAGVFRPFSYFSPEIRDNTQSTNGSTLLNVCQLHFTIYSTNFLAMARSSCILGSFSSPFGLVKVLADGVSTSAADEVTIGSLGFLLFHPRGKKE